MSSGDVTTQKINMEDGKAVRGFKLAAFVASTCSGNNVLKQPRDFNI